MKPPKPTTSGSKTQRTHIRAKSPSSAKIDLKTPTKGPIGKIVQYREMLEAGNYFMKYSNQEWKMKKQKKSRSRSKSAKKSKKIKNEGKNDLVSLKKPKIQ